MDRKIPADDGFSVLVVDDDPIFRSLIAARLLHLDCRLIETADGAEAWHRSRSCAPDLAIIDFEMPGLDGVALVQCLRSHPSSGHIPIVMCTSRHDVSAMRDALDAGVSTFLTKPVNWSMFERHIRHLLDLCRGTKAVRTLKRVAAAQASRDALVSQFTGELDLVLHALQHDTAHIDAQIDLMRETSRAFLSAYIEAGVDAPVRGAAQPAFKRSA